MEGFLEYVVFNMARKHRQKSTDKLIEYNPGNSDVFSACVLAKNGMDEKKMWPLVGRNSKTIYTTRSVE